VNADDRLEQLGIALGEEVSLPGPAPLLTPVLVHHGIAYLSGVGPVGTTGLLGVDFTVEEGRAAARTTAILMLRRIRAALGSLEAVERWLVVRGFVRSGPAFAQQPLVLNGFSELIIDVYGSPRGQCARSAIGVSELPANIPIEVEAVVAVRGG
jgi:enamine deaminase RidA (YjgF/YER057c/UK114 family)